MKSLTLEAFPKCFQNKQLSIYKYKSHAYITYTCMQTTEKLPYTKDSFFFVIVPENNRSCPSTSRKTTNLTRNPPPPIKSSYA